MNREILFRAKSIQTGRWISGYYFEDEDNKSYIGYMSKKRYIPDIRDLGTVEYYENNPTYNWVFVKEEVVSETVGEYTGLTDKNGTKIFEGDIIQSYHHREPMGVAVIYWQGSSFWCDLLSGSQFNCCDTLDDWDCECSLEIIGNVFDNKDIVDAREWSSDGEWLGDKT